jgi:hypothetical protein
MKTPIGIDVVSDRRLNITGDQAGKSVMRDAIKTYAMPHKK